MKLSRHLLRSLALGLGLAGLVAAGWTTATWSDLVRRQLRLTDSVARVEAASAVRLEIVANLLSHELPDRAAFAEPLRDAHQAASGQRLPAVERGQRATLDEFRRAQAELSAALSEFRGSVEAGGPALLRAATEDAAPSLERVTLRLEQGLVQLNRDLESYSASLSAFPASVLAAAIGPDNRGD